MVDGPLGAEGPVPGAVSVAVLVAVPVVVLVTVPVAVLIAVPVAVPVELLQSASPRTARHRLWYARN